MKQKGYTMTELLIVIGMAAMLVGIAAILYGVIHFIAKFW